MYHPRQEVMVFHLFLFAVLVGIPMPLAVAAFVAVAPGGTALPLVVLLGITILVLDRMVRYARWVWKTSTREAFQKVGSLAGLWLLLGGVIAAGIFASMT